MLRGINISRLQPLVNLAIALKEIYPLFDASRFGHDMKNGNAREAFRADLNEVAVAGIKRFPTLIIRQVGKPSLIVSGYRPYEDLLSLISTNFNVSSKQRDVEKFLPQSS
jgi:predicted DsbA family dithiol-disulfide isomerase